MPFLPVQLLAGHWGPTFQSLGLFNKIQCDPLCASVGPDALGKESKARGWGGSGTIARGEKRYVPNKGLTGTPWQFLWAWRGVWEDLSPASSPWNGAPSGGAVSSCQAPASCSSLAGPRLYRGETQPGFHPSWKTLGRIAFLSFPRLWEETTRVHSHRNNPIFRRTEEHNLLSSQVILLTTCHDSLLLQNEGCKAYRDWLRVSSVPVWLQTWSVSLSPWVRLMTAVCTRPMEQ